MLHRKNVSDSPVLSERTAARFGSFNQFKILFVGDLSFGENYQVQYKQKGGENILEERSYDYPLQNLKPILLQSDFVIANLEATITDMVKSPLTDMTKVYVHWTDAKKAPEY